MDTLIDLSSWLFIATYFATSVYIVGCIGASDMALARRGSLGRFPWWKTSYLVLLYLLISPLIAMRRGIEEMT